MRILSADAANSQLKNCER